jgi:hypothetical protein
MEDSSTALVERQPTLSELAEQINECHRLCEATMNAGLQHALEAGRLLLEAKRQCQHGTWLPWLKKNFQGSKRTAQAYLRLHREYPQLKRKAQRVALLSMRQAIVNVANDTHIVYRHEEPVRGEILDVWQKEQCQNARRAAARAQVHRTTRGATPLAAQDVLEADPNDDVVTDGDDLGGRDRDGGIDLDPAADFVGDVDDRDLRADDEDDGGAAEEEDRDRGGDHGDNPPAFDLPVALARLENTVFAQIQKWPNEFLPDAARLLARLAKEML